MFHKRKLFIILGALVFSFGTLSLGYGFWTDILDMEGSADVNLSLRVIDDIVEATSPEALVLIEEPAQNPGGSADSSDTDTSTEETTPIVQPPATDPDTSAPDDTTTVQDPVDTPHADDPADSPTVQEPVDTPPADDPADSSTVQNPVDTPSAEEPSGTPTVEEPSGTPPAAENPTSSPSEGTESSGEI